MPNLTFVVIGYRDGWPDAEGRVSRQHI